MRDTLFSDRSQRLLPRRRRSRTASRKPARLRGWESLEPRHLLAANVVINELHVDPADKTKPLEFIELFNAGDAAADLSGWQFDQGVSYTFPPGTQLPAGGYLVVAENPAALLSNYGAQGLGPFIGSLNNEGERLTLTDAAGVERDRVEYVLGFPWPIVGDDRDYSMELINPSLDNDLGGSWRASVGSPLTGSVLFDSRATWRYREGTAEPSTPISAWRQTSFNDAAWSSGPAALGYGESFIATALNMRGNYSSLYLRKTFTVTSPDEVAELLLEAQYDDGINVWINGTHVVGVNVPGTEVPHTGTAPGAIENTNFVPFTLTNPSSYLVAGTNVIAVQLLNSNLSNSTDAFFDARLTARGGNSPGLTPGAANSVFTTNAPPQMRQVEHSPREPNAGEPVTVTVKATDPDTVAAVSLHYQLVNPGDYISLSDPRYQTQWTTLPMRDDGLVGDAAAGDAVYTVVLPASLQTHRRLVRYRITATDTLGAAATAPDSDDPQPNFAYFVYNDVPAWTGKATPTSPSVTYGSELLKSVATYHLLTTSQAHEQAQSIPNSSAGQYGGSDYLWEGALVYDGEVYDHIRYRARGGVWRYAMGKNMWKFNFNRGHSFQALDDYGNPYTTTWDKLNFSAIVQQGDYLHRGEQGLFESVGFKLFNLAGVAAPNTHYVQFRLITEASENGADQFSGDFQGLYLAVEQPDGRFLDEHNLPDGNFYKMEGGTGTLNNQGPTQPTDKSDLNTFLNTYNNTTPTDQWWRDNLDLESYYSYRSVVESIHHYDIAGGKNYFYYHNPETGQWEVLPWDLDLTWANNMFGSGNEPFNSRVLSRPVFRLEYQNRLRELRDLLYNPEQTGMLIDAMAALVYQPGLPSLVDADRAMWDYNPIMASSYVNPSKSGQGRYYQQTPTRDFAGMISLMKNYIASRGAWIDSNLLGNEAAIPVTPSIAYTGPVSYPLDELSFQTASFQSPIGASFAALQWRIAAVTDPTAAGFDPYDRTQGRNYEITPSWESGELTTFANSIDIDSSNLVPGETYRVRVRMKDSAGAWSHWSQPITFVASAPIGPLVTGLRVTEINYHPAEPTAAELASQLPGDPAFTANDFEFIELRNRAVVPIDLTGVRFTVGITFNFTGSAVTALAPGEFVLVVTNPDAFEARYGTGLPIAGVYSGSLSNSGEALELVADRGGVILAFEYDDQGDWPGRADGKGATLEMTNLGGDYNDAENWRSSSEYGGTPGFAGAGPSASVVINEVLTHTAAPRLDFIELHNPSPLAIDIGGWYLSNSSDDYRKYRIPAGTVLAAGGYRVFDEQEFNAAGSPTGFAFDGLAGGEVWLMAADSQDRLTRFVNDVSLDAALLHESFARWPNGSGDLVPQATLTPGSANAGPRIAPIVISEIMYHPADLPGGVSGEHLEYVEITNTGDDLIDVGGWQLDGVGYTIPIGTLISPRQIMLLVKFNPHNAAALAQFEAVYDLVEETFLLGPFTGTLANSGERLTLLRPVADSSSFVVIDEVRYDDASPWPTTPDGDGAALSRRHCAASGSDSTNWRAAVPNPGADTCTAPAQVVDRHTFYNNSAFDGNSPAANAADDAAIAPDKQALLPEGSAAFANYTSHPAGITGVMVDIAGLPPGVTLTAAQFLIRIGKTNQADIWTEGPPPQQVSVRRGAGTEGSDRVTLVFAPGSIVNTWLQVIVLPGAITGLADADVFYFGNAAGETGDSADDAFVNAADFADVRNHPHTFLNPAPADSRWDLNRDGRVNALDLLIVRDHASVLGSLVPLVSALPESPAAVEPVQELAAKSANVVSGIDFGLRSRTEAVSKPPLLRRGTARSETNNADDDSDDAAILHALATLESLSPAKNSVQTLDRQLRDEAVDLLFQVDRFFAQWPE